MIIASRAGMGDASFVADIASTNTSVRCKALNYSPHREERPDRRSAPAACTANLRGGGSRNAKSPIISDGAW